MSQLLSPIVHAVLIERPTRDLRRVFGRLDRRPLGLRSVGFGTAHAHDVREPARLREGIEHQDQEDRERRRQKRPGSAEQPRPEDEPNEEDGGGDAQAPPHKHRRERVLRENIYDYYPQYDQKRV